LPDGFTCAIEVKQLSRIAEKVSANCLVVFI